MDENTGITNRLMSRRQFLKKATLGIAGTLAAAALGAYSRFVEPDWLHVTRLDIPIPALDPAFDGLRLAQISDLHASDMMPVKRLKAGMEKVNELQPDVIAITGDFIGTRAEAAPALTEVLPLLAPAITTLAVLGNHDYWTDASLIRRILSAVGIKELQNDVYTLTRGSARLHFAGLDDAREGKSNLAQVLARLSGDSQPAVLLAHEPDPADDYAQSGRFALQLSGHSHGGQVRLPFFGPLVRPFMAKKYPSGLYQVGNMRLYTNRGLASFPIPLRFNCPPEITLFTLRTAPLSG